jgi:hypothetical protein
MEVQISLRKLRAWKSRRSKSMADSWAVDGSTANVCNIPQCPPSWNAPKDT